MKKLATLFVAVLVIVAALGANPALARKMEFGPPECHPWYSPTGCPNDPKETAESPPPREYVVIGRDRIFTVADQEARDDADQLCRSGWTTTRYIPVHTSEWEVTIHIECPYL